MLAGIRSLLGKLKNVVGQAACVQPATGALLASPRPVRQVVHTERVSRSVGNSRTPTGAVHMRKLVGRGVIHAGATGAAVVLASLHTPALSMERGVSRGLRRSLAETTRGVRTTVLSLCAVSALGGCAFLVDRGPDDLGRFADCRKVGCL